MEPTCPVHTSSRSEGGHRWGRPGAIEEWEPCASSASASPRGSPRTEEPGGPPTPHEGLPVEALLTEQESAVFLCLATGASNRELAVELQLSVSTVKFHVVNIRAKLGGISRLQACLLAALAREDTRRGDADSGLSDVGGAAGHR
ncbi:helix-turn-helix transcriptional regulator [Streptomyces sp. MS1.HAVA.3]|uniref:Helix-turn-helix transcriptional regulator n=1 Tax=Streptomyces caledonius TaxID=3134107 RepID=A0ABU8U547_9ACTN